MMSDKLRAAAKAALDWLKSTKTQSMEEYLQVVESLKAALAEPEQEPVACIRTDGGLMWLKKPSTIYSKPRPLYAAPPRREWVGLTDEEINAIPDGEYMDFYKAIEAKLKEKNT